MRSLFRCSFCLFGVDVLGCLGFFLGELNVTSGVIRAYGLLHCTLNSYLSVCMRINLKSQTILKEVDDTSY